MRKDEIMKPKDVSRLSKACISQPCCTAIQVALVDVLNSYGIIPQAVVGHSSGEIAAAYASGAITSRVAIIIAYFRGVVLSDDTGFTGGMAAISFGAASMQPYLRNGVTIGCENSPESITLTGEKSSLVDVVDAVRLDHPSISTRILHVDRAYHSGKQLIPVE